MSGPFASVIYSHAGASSGFRPHAIRVRPSRPGRLRGRVVRMAAEEVLILLQQERTHRVAHASQCPAGGQSCNPVISGQMSQDFFTTVHDRLLCDPVVN